MAELGLAYALEATRLYLSEDVSGTPRLDAEIDRIEAQSPTPSIAIDDMVEYTRYRNPRARTPRVSVSSEGRIQPARPAFSKCHPGLTFDVLTEVVIIPRDLGEQTHEQMAAGVVLISHALASCLQGGCGGPGDSPSVKLAYQLNGRVARSDFLEVKHSPIFVGHGRQMRPADDITITARTRVTLQPANT